MIGSLLGTLDGKLIDITNSIPMTLLIKEKGEKQKNTGEKKDDDHEVSKEPEYVMDTEYLKKMVKFHRSINE